MTAYQFSQPWLSELTGKNASTALEFSHLRNYLKGLDDGTIPLFNLNALNATIGNLTTTSGITVGGNIAMAGFKLTGLGAGSTNGDSLRYEQLIGLYLLLAGGTMSGAIAMGSNKITGLTSGTASGDAVNFGQYQQATTNILDNGGFEIWQRGTSFSDPANTIYVADRWNVLTNEAATVTVTRDSTTVDNGTYSLKAVLTGSGASKYWFVQQRIENYKDYGGKTVTVSVRVHSSVASAIRVSIDDNVASAASSYHTGGGGWETLTVTKTISASATFMAIYVGMNGAGDKKNGTYYFDSAMLVLGSENVSFVPTNPQVDLARCQRFFYVWGADTTGTYVTVMQAFSATGTGGSIRYPVTMRTTPTATVNNETNFQSVRANGTSDAITTLAVDVIGPNAARISVTTVNLVAGDASILYAGNVNASVFFSADL